MDGRTFDQLVRSVTKTTSRRATFRGLLAGVAAATTGALSLEAADAAKCVKVGNSCKKKKGKPKPKCCGSAKCRGGDCKCTGSKQECKGECINKNECCTSKDCPGNQQCNNKNKCVCGNGQELCGNQCIANGAVCDVEVTPNSLKGWDTLGEDPDSQSPLLTTFVADPSGDSSLPGPSTSALKIQPIAHGTFPVNQVQAVFRNRTYAGTNISVIQTLTYDSYVPAVEGSPVVLNVAVLNSNSIEANGFTSINFLPGSAGNPAPVDDNWEPMNATEGLWFFTRDICTPDDNCLYCRGFGAPNAEGCCADDLCTGNRFVTWQQAVDANPDAVVNGDDPANGGISFRRGRDNGDAGFIANVQINDELFYFTGESDV